MADELLTDAITKALAYTENGGKLDLNNPKAGKTGEMKSIFQFTPDTWKNYAKQVFGQDNVPMDADSETYVVKQKVGKWLDQGYSPSQIASMWNAGVGEPDAYTGKFSNGAPSAGINKKYGVHYDVPSYAKKVAKYTDQFYKQKAGGGQMTQGGQQAPQQDAGSSASVPGLQPLLAMIKSTSSAPKAPSATAPGANKGSGLLGMLINSKV